MQFRKQASQDNVLHSTTYIKFPQNYTKELAKDELSMAQIIQENANVSEFDE